MLFFKEVLGGVALGLLLGCTAYYFHSTVENERVEILVSLAVVAGGYPLALALHISGPIAMVVAGLLIGNHGRSHAMGDEVRQQVDTLWELIDEILNAVAFCIVGSRDTGTCLAFPVFDCRPVDDTDGSACAPTHNWDGHCDVATFSDLQPQGGTNPYLGRITRWNLRCARAFDPTRSR